VTPRPLIHGIQSAVVTGPAGEEIHTDEYGRIKVQFHWDRYGQKDAKTSCWLRVAFLAAGARWGFVSIPRIGHEVIVSFLEGDPDRPLVTGVVYNGANMPPWDLPANKTQWGMLSRSTLKGAEKVPPPRENSTGDVGAPRRGSFREPGVGIPKKRGCPTVTGPLARSFAASKKSSSAADSFKA